MKTYRTSQVAAIIGVHPNTVRLYEKWELIPPVQRAKNGYRVFTEFHIAVFKLARLAFYVEVLQSGLRKQIIAVVKAVSAEKFSYAFLLLEDYRHTLMAEQDKAREAIRITERLLAGQPETGSLSLKRKDAAAYLEITIDTLRNWELNGLVQVKRTRNRYRIYTETDIARLKIIRTLRYAGYSLEAILRLLNDLSALTSGGNTIAHTLNTPRTDEDIVSACDHLLISLEQALTNTVTMKKMLTEISQKF